MKPGLKDKNPKNPKYCQAPLFSIGVFNVK